MKRLLHFFATLVLILTLGSNALGQNVTTIDFEVAGDGYSTTDEYGSNFTDLFNRTNYDLPNCTNEDGFFWGFEDMTAGNKVIDLDQIDITGATEFTFSIDMVAHHYNDWDRSDAFEIDYSVDGGTYTPLMHVRNNGGTYNELPSLDTDFDGVGDCGAGTLPALSTGTSGCSTSSSDFATFSTTITGLSGNTMLDIRLTAINCTSEDEGMYFDNIEIDHNGGLAPPDITISDNSQPTAGTVNQGAQDHILSAFSAAVTTSNATLNTLDIDINGTFDSDDVDDFQLFYSATNSFGSATQLGSNITGNGNGTSQSLSFTGLAQDINTGNTGYFWVVADVSTTATASNTLTAQIPTLTFTSGNITNNVTAAGTQTIQAVTPSAALNSNNPAVAAGSLTQNTTHNEIYAFELAVTNATAELNDATLSTSAGINEGENLKLWYSTDNTFNDQVDTELGSIASPTSGTESFNFVQSISSGSTGYFFVTIDVPCNATNASTFNITAIATGDLTFSSATNTSGTAFDGGTQTVTEAAPNEAGSFAASPSNGSVDLSWTDPTGCFDEVMIIAGDASITHTPSGTSYSANPIFGGVGGDEPEPGEFVVYKSTGQSVSVTGLTNGTQYFFKIFTRNGSTWSAGTEISETPSASASQFFVVDFDANVGYTTSATEGGNNTDYFKTTDGSDISETFNGSTNSGGDFFAAMDMDGAGFNDLETITISNIDIQGYTNLEIRVYIAEGDDGSNQDWDANTEFLIDYDIDAGGIQDGLHVQATGGTNTEPAIDTDYDGLGDGTTITDTWTQFTHNISGTGNSMDITITFDNLDSGDEDIAIDDIAIYGIPSAVSTLDLADNGSQIATGNVNQGDTEVILSQTQVAVTTADAELTEFAVDMQGSFTGGAGGDIDQIQLWYSTDNILNTGSDVLLGSITGSNVPGSSGTATFSGLSQTITDGNTGYFFVTADVDASATAASTFGVQVPTYTFVAGNENTNTMTGGGLQTVNAVSSDVTLADNGSFSASSTTLTQGSVDVPLASFQITAANANAAFNGLDITTTGTYQATDFDDTQGTFGNFELWYSTDASLDTASDQMVDAVHTPAAPGLQQFAFTGASEITINDGNTGYFFITASTPCAATDGKTIGIAAISTSDLSFNGSVNTSGGPTSASSTFTFDNATPQAVASAGVTGLDASSEVSWTDPASGCFTEFLVVVSDASITGTPSAADYTVSSLSYSDGNNPTLNAGEVIVYEGSTSPQTVTGLTNGTQYYFKVFAQNGDVWETVGVEQTATPVDAPASGDLVISAVYDADLSGGTPKGVELYALNSISDLSFFALGSANNGGGTDGPEFPLPADALNAGEYYYVSSESPQFTNFFGFAPDATTVAMGINGDDAVELFYDASKGFSGSESVADVFGDINVDGTGEAWEYDDGWAYRVNGTGPDGSTFVLSNWTFSGVDTLLNETTNASASNPIPIALYSEISGYVLKSNGNWSPENPAGVTTTSDNITVQSSTSLSGNIDCNNFTVESGNTVTVPANVTLTVESAVANNGTITIQNNGSLVQNSVTDNNSGSGTFNVVRNTGSLQDDTYYNFWSSPVQSASLSNVFPNTNTVDFYTHINGSWAAASGTMDQGVGYTATGDTNVTYPTSFDRTFSGDVNNGTITINVSAGANDYILIGNPYPSAIDYSAFFADNTGNISANKYYWNHTDNLSGDYAQRNGSGGTGGNGGVSPGSYTSTAQGFFVQATGNLSTITFENDQRIAGNNDQFFSTILSDVNRSWLNLTNDQGAFNQILIALSDEATDGIDRMLDGEKLKGNTQLAFYSKLNSKDFGIQALKKPTVSQSKTIELGVDALVNGEYTIALDSLDNWPNDYSLVLVDTQEGVEINLLTDTAYAFEVSQAGTIAQRFYLNIERNIEENNGSNDDDPFTDPSTSVDDLQANLENLKVYQAQDLLWIDAVNTELHIEQVELITVKGQTVRTERFESGNRRQSIPTAELAQGIYFVRISAANGTTINHKVFIK